MERYSLKKEIMLGGIEIRKGTLFTAEIGSEVIKVNCSVGDGFFSIRSFMEHFDLIADYQMTSIDAVNVINNMIDNLNYDLQMYPENTLVYEEKIKALEIARDHVNAEIERRASY